MQKGDIVKFRSKNASRDYRTLSKGQVWANKTGESFARKLKKDPYRNMTITEMSTSTTYDEKEIPMAKIEGVFVPCSLLIPV